MSGTNQSNTIKADAPAVSIIIPIYNTAAYLEDCIASVVNQTFTDFEVILVNDGSTDKSMELCEKARREDPRIHLISSSERKGVSHARNTGIDSAVGKYLFFLDSDDMLHPQILEQLYLQTQKLNLDMCAAGFVSSERCDEKNWKTLCSRPFSPKWQVLPSNEVMEHWFHLSSFNLIWGKLYLKEAVHDLRFDENESLAEDTLFNYHFVSALPRRISYTDDYGYYYRLRNDSANRTISSEGLIASLKIKRFISDKELSAGRRENAVIMEKEYVRQIRRYIYLSRNKEEKKKAEEFLQKEKKNPLFKEISHYEKCMIFLILYFMPAYKALYKMRRISLRIRSRNI